MQISSTRCGGLGLNLTCANRVILVDLWWNIAIEAQAFGRVQRIGQTKPMYFAKIMARNTIDQVLVDVQTQKENNIAAVLQDNKSETIRKDPTVEELLRLFGGGDDDGEAAQNRVAEDLGSG